MPRLAAHRQKTDQKLKPSSGQPLPNASQITQPVEPPTFFTQGALRMNYRIALLSLAVTLPICGVARADITTGLVAEYSFDYCNGADVTDHGHDATLRGPATSCVLGKKGDLAYAFNGTNYYEIPYHSQFNVAKEVSYSAWLKLDAYGGQIISTSYKEFALTTEGRSSIYLTNCLAVNLTSRSILPKGEWTFVTATYDGTYARLYTNGLPDGTILSAPSCDVPDWTSNLSIGTAAFKGAIDDVRVYQRALTATDVKQLYGATARPQIAGTAPWGTSHTVSCKNITQGTETILTGIVRRAAWT